MKLSAIIALLASTATASVLPRGGDNGQAQQGNSGWGLSLPNAFSSIPGYPLGSGLCLSDSQANFIANAFKTILTNPDRQAAAKLAGSLIADGYVEESDSINFLAGYPLGGPSFSGKQTYIQSIQYAPAIPEMQTLDIFHDCTRISWRWNVPHLGANKYPVKGINDFTVNSPAKGQVLKSFLEFSSIAWGQDIGWTCQAPPPGGHP